MSQITRPARAHHEHGAVIPSDIYDPAVNALRLLAVDAITRHD